MNEDVTSLLVAKLKAYLTVDDESFIAFKIPGAPATPKSYAFQLPEEESNLTPNESLNAMSNFAYFVNQVPNVSSHWLPTGGTLWNEYRDVLTQSTVAGNQLTSQEEIEFLQAKKILRRHLHKPNKLSDSELAEAHADIDRIAGRNPQLAWVEFREIFDRSERTDFQNQTFYDTYFHPANILQGDNSSGWIAFSLDTKDIDFLNAQPLNVMGEIPSNRQTPTATQKPDSDVLELSFEMASVDIIRPWFNPSLFNKRYWRWSDERLPISDGNNPPKGTIVAYANRIVFVRNIEVKFKVSNDISEENYLDPVPELSFDDPDGFEKYIEEQLDSIFEAGQLSFLNTAGFTDYENNKLTDQYLSLLIKRVAPESNLFAKRSSLFNDEGRLNFDHLKNLRLDLGPEHRQKNSRDEPSPKLPPVHIGPLTTEPVKDSYKVRSNLRIARMLSESTPMGGGKLEELILAENVAIASMLNEAMMIAEGRFVKDEPLTSINYDLQLIAFICQRTPKSPSPDESLDW